MDSKEYEDKRGKSAGGGWGSVCVALKVRQVNLMLH